MAVTRLATSRGTSSPAGTRGSSWRRRLATGTFAPVAGDPGSCADRHHSRLTRPLLVQESKASRMKANQSLAVATRRGRTCRRSRNEYGTIGCGLPTNATSTEARRCRRRSRRGSRLPRPAGSGYSRSGSMPSSGQRSRKSRSASAIWRSTIGVRTAPRAGSLASADRPSGVAAKDASACSSLASKRSTIAILA